MENWRHSAAIAVHTLVDGASTKGQSVLYAGPIPAVPSGAVVPDHMARVRRKFDNCGILPQTVEHGTPRAFIGVGLLLYMAEVLIQIPARVDERRR